MTRAIGPRQRQLLELARSPEGLTWKGVSAAIGDDSRKASRVIRSLVVRGAVVRVQVRGVRGVRFFADDAAAAAWVAGRMAEIQSRAKPPEKSFQTRALEMVQRPQGTDPREVVADTGCAMPTAQSTLTRLVRQQQAACAWVPGTPCKRYFADEAAASAWHAAAAAALKRKREAEKAAAAKQRKQERGAAKETERSKAARTEAAERVDIPPKRTGLQGEAVIPPGVVPQRVPRQLGRYEVDPSTVNGAFARAGIGRDVRTGREWA